MTLRFRQWLLTVALAAPLGVAIATAPPFAADTRAQGPSRMLGPNFPVKVDSNGDGLPGSGDESNAWCSFARSASRFVARVSR